MVVSLQMSHRINRKNVMLVIKLMGKYLPVKRPAKCVRQHSEE